MKDDVQYFLLQISRQIGEDRLQEISGVVFASAELEIYLLQQKKRKLSLHFESFLFGSPEGNRTPAARMKTLSPNH